MGTKVYFGGLFLYALHLVPVGHFARLYGSLKLLMDFFNDQMEHLFLFQIFVAKRRGYKLSISSRIF